MSLIQLLVPSGIAQAYSSRTDLHKFDLANPYEAVGFLHPQIYN